MIPASKAILELVDEGLKFHHVVVKGNADSNIEAMVRLKIDSLPAAVAAAVAAAPTATEVNPVADPNVDPAAAASAAAAAAVPTAAGGPAEVEETTMAEGSCEEMEAAAVMASVSNGAAPVVAAAAGTAGAAGAAAAPGGAGASQDVVVASAPVQEADAPGEVAGNVGEAAVFKVVDFRVGVTRIDGAPVSKDNKVAKNFIRVNGFDQVSNDIYKIKMKMCDSTNKNFAVYRITATVTDGVNITIIIINSFICCC